MQAAYKDGSCYEGGIGIDFPDEKEGAKFIKEFLRGSGISESDKLGLSAIAKRIRNVQKLVPEVMKQFLSRDPYCKKKLDETLYTTEQSAKGDGTR
ncbi:hypothetical protein ABW19_dt0206148 [Dactylella cylindrospora]|nr:hypothetical protein ABW19_dt0206148 [Dactylella cylindrospora]